MKMLERLNKDYEEEKAKLIGNSLKNKILEDRTRFEICWIDCI